MKGQLFLDTLQNSLLEVEGMEGGEEAPDWGVMAERLRQIERVVVGMMDKDLLPPE